MKTILGKDNIVFIDTAIRRTVKIDLVQGYINGKPVEALSPAYTDLVPADHPVALIARILGNEWLKCMNEYAGRRKG